MCVALVTRQVLYGAVLALGSYNSDVLLLLSLHRQLDLISYLLISLVTSDRNRHHWKQSVLPPSLANRLGPKEFRGLKSRGLGSTSKGSAEEIARRHRMMRGQHGGEGSQGQRRRTDRKMR